jgi:hypothetical protein
MSPLTDRIVEYLIDGLRQAGWKLPVAAAEAG